MNGCLRRRDAGMTLVEVLFSASLALVIMGAVFFLFSQGLRAWSDSQGRVNAQQSALLAMHRLTSDLQLSDINSVTTYAAGPSGPAGISFLSAVRDGCIQHDSYGEILWQKFSVYYLEPTTRTLRYREEPIGPPAHGHPLGTPTRDPNPVKLAGGFHPAADDRVVATHISSASFLVAIGGNPLHMELRAEDAQSGRGSSLKASVVMENGFIKANSINWTFVQMNPILITPLPVTLSPLPTVSPP